MSVSIQAVHGLRFSGTGGLKSTQERQERQQKCTDQVDFFEKQKENLKNMRCDSLEDIARKLDMFHSYEDQIAAAKKEYNNSQMSHVLDEAREIGEKIAEAADKMAPKTPEEREKEKIEEATGSEEENKGMLSEIMEEVTEEIEDLQEEMEEELEEEALEENTAELAAESMQENAEAGEAANPEEAFTAKPKEPEAVQADTVTEMTLSEAVEQKIEQDRLEKALERTVIFSTPDAVRHQHIDYRL